MAINDKKEHRYVSSNIPIPHKPKNFKGFHPFIAGVIPQHGGYASHVAARKRSEKAWAGKEWILDSLNRGRIGGTG